MKGTRCFSIRRFLYCGCVTLLAVSIFSLILLLVPDHSCYAQGMGNNPHATGLIMMTPEEAETFRMTHGRVEAVRPNRIALRRINNARAKKGQPPLPESFAASPGQELVFSEGAGASGDEDFTYSSLTYS